MQRAEEAARELTQYLQQHRGLWNEFEISPVPHEELQTVVVNVCDLAMRQPVFPFAFDSNLSARETARRLQDLLALL